MNEWIFSSTILILAICVIRMIVKGKVSLRLQYFLWALVLLRLLVPVNFFQSEISVTNLANQVRSADDAAEIHFSAPVAEEINRPVRPPVTQEQQLPQEDVQITQPSESQPSTIQPTVTQPSVTLPPVTESLPEHMAPNNTVSDHITDTPKREPAKTEPQISWADIALWCWLGGMAVMGSFLLVVNIRFYLRLRRSRQALAIPFAPVRVFVTNVVQSPCLFGLYRPAIYLPTAVAEDYDALQHVYAHELTHYYHLDFIWSALRSACLVIHWYNPLVWVAAKLSRQDAEMACDEGALKRIGEDERAEYGRTLVHLTCRESFSGMLVAATTMTGGKKEIKERIVLLMKKPRTAVYSAIVLALVATILVGCTFSGSVDTKNNDTETKETEEITEIQDTTELQMVELTEDELLAFEQMFSEHTEETGYNWYNMALLSTYSRPEDVDFSMLFYNGFKEERAGAEEEEKLLAIVKAENGEEEAEWWANGDTVKNPKAKMDQVLKTYFGVSFEQTNRVNLAYMVYLEETDSYYTYAYDCAGVGYLDFTSGYRTGDGKIVLNYEHFLYDTCMLTLVKAPEGAEKPYYVYSNLPVNPENGEDAPNDEIILEPQLEGLTMAELQAIQQMFSGQSDSSEHYWYYLARSAEYSSPEAVELDMLFFLGTGEAPIGAEEWKLLQEAGFASKENLFKSPRAEMDQVLKTYFGISLEQADGLGLNKLYYLEETDSYYNDTNEGVGRGDMRVIRASRTEDGKISVHYEDQFSGGEFVLTLVEATEGSQMPYYVYSHLPVNWETGKTTLGADEFPAYVTVQSADAFFRHIRFIHTSSGQGINWAGRSPYGVIYQDLTYMSYYPLELEGHAYRHQICYQGDRIAGHKYLGVDTEPYCTEFANYYTVTYEDSEAFVLMSFHAAGANYYWHVLAFDTNGNVLADDWTCGTPTFDMDTATLTYDTCEYVSNDDPNNYYEEEIHTSHEISLKKSVDGEPMIAVVADPGNYDLTYYYD